MLKYKWANSCWQIKYDIIQIRAMWIVDMIRSKLIVFNWEIL